MSILSHHKDSDSRREITRESEVPNGQKRAWERALFNLISAKAFTGENQKCKKQKSKVDIWRFPKWVEKRISKIKIITKKIDKFLIFYVVSHIKYDFKKVFTLNHKGYRIFQIFMKV